MDFFGSAYVLCYLLATFGLHRIWNYEDICARPRTWLRSFGRWWLKPLTCPPCNAYWVAVANSMWFFLLNVQAARVFEASLAGFAFVRILYLAFPSPAIVTPTAAPAPAAPVLLTSTAPPIKPAASGCSECEARREALKQDRVLSYRHRAVLLTTLNDFHPSYSVSSVVLEQARMLAADPTWLVQVWVNQTANMAGWPEDMPSNVEIRKNVPSTLQEEDKIDPRAVQIIVNALRRDLVALGNAVIIAHDFIFLTWHINFAAAMHIIGNMPAFRWWHQCHSGVDAHASRPVDGDPRMMRRRLPVGDHRLLCVAQSHRESLATYYGASIDSVDVLPNSRDPRTLLRASPEVQTLVTQFDLLSADVMAVLPLSTPRAIAKGAQHAIRVIGAIERLGKKVRLVIANAHANDNEAMLTYLDGVAVEAGLSPGSLIFVSRRFPAKASVGLPSEDIQTLFQLSNVFIFPTIAEASSLSVMEAAVAGNLLVLNGDVPSLFDIVPRDSALTYPWGTDGDGAWPTLCPSVGTVATDILRSLKHSPANSSKRAVIQGNNRDVLGARLREILLHR